MKNSSLLFLSHNESKFAEVSRKENKMECVGCKNNLNCNWCAKGRSTADEGEAQQTDNFQLSEVRELINALDNLNDVITIKELKQLSENTENVLLKITRLKNNIKENLKHFA